MSMSEKALAGNIEHLCQYLHVRYYHTWTSIHSTPGFPDYVLLLPNGALKFRECKTKTGKLTKPQQEWIADLERCGQDVGVWRPEDWMSGRILTELKGQ